MLKQRIETLVHHALDALGQDGTLPPDAPRAFRIERPREKQHGDFSTNAAMLLAKAARLPPRDLAQRLLRALPAGQTLVERSEVAGPGFINFHLAPGSVREMIPEILQAGTAYGHAQTAAGRRVQVEFVSANPTGPMHVGHGRGAVTGDVIARLLEAVGCTVEREYYINDAGAQVKVLGRSVLLRYLELFGHAVTIPAGCYPGEYVTEIAQSLQNRDGDRWLDAAQSAQDPPQAVIDFAMEQVLTGIRTDLERLEIRFDHWFSERTLHDQGGITHAIAVLEQKGLIHTAVLEPPKGKLPDDWEPAPQLLFRATAFGDEVDRPLKKSDGSFTYFAADIAYHLNKAERGFDKLINVWGADHGGYVKRVDAALEALTGKKNLLDVRLVQMVNLTRGGQPVKMSKRAGTFVTLGDVVEQTSPAAVRFWFLTRAGTSQLDFDLELAVSKSNDNPVWYVQYAVARVNSVWNQVKDKELPETNWDQPGSPLVAVELAPLALESELDLIRKLDLFPEVVEGAALAHEPHRIPYYLLELAAIFHAYYNQNRILDGGSDAQRRARLALITATRQVLVNGLRLLGIHPMEKM